MDLPIDDKELNTLIMITGKVKGDGLGKKDVDAEKLYNKLKLVKNNNSDGFQDNCSFKLL